MKKKIKHIGILTLGFFIALSHYVLFVLDNIITSLGPRSRPSLNTFSNTPMFLVDAIIRISIIIFVYLLVWLLI